LRNAIWSLITLAIAVLAVIFLLPVLGVLLLVVAGLIVLAVGAIWALPWLMKLPWFKKRIHMEETPFGRTIRFGGGQYTTYRGNPYEPERPAGAHLDEGDVIDVEGRELPEKDEP
jgi:hypothetical protein